MCFAPPRCALFQHLNFQSAEAEVFCTFWLGNVLRATTACTFSTSQLPKVVRTCCVLYILTSKCASRHTGVQLFISHLTTWLRTRRFSEPTFRPSGATNQWKKYSVSRLSYLFAHLHLLSSDSFSSLIFFLLFSSLPWLFPPLLFHLSILSEVWLLNFLRPTYLTSETCWKIVLTFKHAAKGWQEQAIQIKFPGKPCVVAHGFFNISHLFPSLAATVFLVCSSDFVPSPEGYPLDW